MDSRQTLKMLVIVNAKRVIEILETLPANELNNSCYLNSQSLKAELKAKMHELRRDTVRVERALTTWERRS